MNGNFIPFFLPLPCIPLICFIIFSCLQLLQQAIDLLDGCPASFRNPFAPARIDDFRIGFFFLAHGLDDCFHMDDLFVIHLKLIEPFHLVGAGLSSSGVHQWPHLLHLSELLEEVIERKGHGTHLLLQFLRLLFIDVACAFSIRDRTSPIPRILDAMRSGWNARGHPSFHPYRRI